MRHAGEHHGAAGGRGGFPLVPQGAGAARRDARPGGGPVAWGVTSLGLNSDVGFPTRCKRAAAGATSVMMEVYRRV